MKSAGSIPTGCPEGSAFSGGGKGILEALITELEAIEDPRCGWKIEHQLIDVLVITVCAVLGEAESFEDITLYNRYKKWIERRCPLWLPKSFVTMPEKPQHP
jgi:hypothetical protein